LEFLKSYVIQGISTFVGCVLLAIGLSGILGLPLYPISAISYLAEPSGVSDSFDRQYCFALAFVGFWLVLFFFVRFAALAGIVLIVGKWAIQHDILPV
jgi:hypothetical protein